MKAAALAAVLTILFFASLSAADYGGDITPPALVAATADRYQIDTSNAPQTITLTLHITDDLSGAVRVQVDFKHEHGYNDTRLCFVSVEASTDALVICPVWFPRYSAEGRWMVVWYGLHDSVGNSYGRRVADCVGEWIDNRCTQYDYLEDASAVTRSIEILVGPLAPGEDPPLYLPWITR